MSTRFLKSLSALVTTLSLVPAVAAAPIPVSSPTAIALIVYLSVVPASLILLLIVKYLYVKSRKATVVSGYTHPSDSSSQLPFLVGLLGSPDWEIRMKESERSTVQDTSSQFSFLPSVRHPISHSTDQRNKFSLFRRLGRAPRSPGLRFPPVALSVTPPDQSFFYALDTPGSSTQSSLGNLLPDSALVRLVSMNSQSQLAEFPGYSSKNATEIPALAHNCSTSSASFSRPSPEIRSPPKAKRCTLRRRTPPILPIQTPPDSPILVEPKESASGGNFVFYLHTPEPLAANRRISHPYAQSQMNPSASATSRFPRSPSQEFHTCDEQSPMPGPGQPSPGSPSTTSMHRLLGNVTPSVKSLSPSLFVNTSGGSPFFASTPVNQGPAVPRKGGVSYMEDSLGGQPATHFVSSSPSAITGAKLVPFSASARASVVSESPSYNSEHAYQGGASPTVPYELEEYYNYVGREAVLPTPRKTESPVFRNGHGHAASSPDVISFTGGGNHEPSNFEPGSNPSFCVPGALFPIPEEDTQAESSGSRSKSDPSSCFNGSGRFSTVGSLPLTSSSGGGELAVSFFSTSGSFRVVHHSTPGVAGAGRPAPAATESSPISGTMAQTMLRGTGNSETSPPNVSALRVGARESYPGSGDLNDGTEISGACMNGLYEELEEWGCEWILQNQPRQSGPSTGRTEVGKAL